MPAASKTLTLLLLVGALVFATGCGEDRSHLLPGNTAEEIATNLDEIQNQVKRGDCFMALESAGQVQKQVEGLGSEVDRTLKRALLDGVVTLQSLVANNCDENSTDPEAEIETVPEETETEVTPTGTTGATGTTEAETPSRETESGNGGNNRPNQGNGNRPNRPNRPTNPPAQPNPPVKPPTDTNPPPDNGDGSGGISPDAGG